MRDFVASKGVFREVSSRNVKNLLYPVFSLRKFFRDAADELHIAYYDPCCSDTPTDSASLRFNVSTSSIEYYDGTQWLPVSLDNEVVTTSLTAFATGGQSSGVALSPGYNNLTTVATAGDSVKLPAALAGLVVVVRNNGAAAADVFPATADTINGGSANAAVRIAPNSTITFTAINTTDWETNNEVLSTNHITEQTAGSGITFDKGVIFNRTSTAKSAAATLTALEVASGLLTYTGGAATITLPSATALATQLGATKGTTFDWIVDNAGGSGTVTIAVGANIVAASAVTGGTTLTLAQSATVGSAGFKFTFLSATAAIISRIY